MIIPGSKLGLIDIGSKLHDYPDAEFIENLSLNQKLYRIKGYYFRVDESNKIILVSTKDKSEEGCFEIIKIGSKFSDVVERFVLLYDDFEFVFHIENIDGLYFTFDFCPVSEPDFLSKEISLLCVYDKELDANNNLLGFERITKENLKGFIY